MANSRPAHLVFFPFPTQGHVNPFLSLALNLLSSSPSLAISFLCTRYGYDKLSKVRSALTELNLHIHFHIIPEDQEGSFPETRVGDGKGMVFSHLITQFEWLQGRATAIQNLLTTDLPPISCMLVDYFLPWTTEIAAHVGAQWCVFCTSSALWVRNRFLAAAIATTADDAVDVDKPLETLIRRWTDYEREWCRNMARADCVLLNTFPDIDAATVDSIPMETMPKKAIGPVLSPPNLSLEEEDIESLAWLDTQPHSSVIYISFGSVAELPLQQLKELALGIEASGCRFLWVIRNLTQSDNLEILPDGFLDNGRGCVVPWVAQLRVLKHPAIAFFLTHCGWNSIVEAVTAGVPMLCMPTFGDQFLNSDQVIKEWGVGLPIASLKRGEEDEGSADSIVDRTDIERFLRVAMEEETATHFKLKSAKLAEIVRGSLQKGGSSYENMTEFLQIISNK